MQDNTPIFTITGSDSTGGSGVQADIKTISALGGYAVSAITTITIQNTLGIQDFYDLPAEAIHGQIEALVNDIQPQIVKIGLIRSVDVLEVIIDMLIKYHPRYILYVPIVRSSNGEQLMTDDVVAQVRQRLLPLCSLVIEERHSVHGESNAFASAIAVYLSQGDSIEEAQIKAKKYVNSLHAPALTTVGRSGELYSEFLKAITKYVATNSDVGFYANCLNVSPRYLAQVCRKIGESSPKQLIDEVLAQKVAYALKSTTKTVQELAYDFGFSSQAHFAKFFKKQMKLTPSQYRKNK